MTQSQQMGLHQTLSPQMRQSLEILQATALELRHLVQQELEFNPVLEEVAESPGPEGAETPGAEAGDRESEAGGEAEDRELETLLKLDEDWRDFSASGMQEKEDGAEAQERKQFLLDSLVAPETLQQHLLAQLPGLDLDARQRRVAAVLVGNLDDDGFLQTPLGQAAAEAGVEPAEAGEVLKRVQTLDPPGVAARDLRECLLLQLERTGQGTGLAARMVADHLDALGRRKLPEVAEALGVNLRDVQQAAEWIARLDPKPGRAFSGAAAQYITPDVVIERVGDDYTVSLTNEQIPHLRISKFYRDMLGEAGSGGEVRGYIRDRIRSGKFLIKSIHQRQQTILAIARELVERQRPFLDHGKAALQPLTMAQVAAAVGVHETTVSRAIAGKYVSTPHGIFEMKFFFAGGYRAADGSQVSNTSVKDAVAALIRAENPRKPLSDQQIVERLAEGGLQVARRTVAKYREELGILPSHLRKSF